MDDRYIIALFFERSEDAIIQTKKKYGGLCNSIAANILSDASDVEECENDTYLALWNSIPPTNPENLKAYTAKTTRNIALKRLEYNSAAKRSKHLQVPFQELENCFHGTDIAEAASEEELGRLINSFLRGQKQDMRNVFLRRYWFFDSISDIAGRYSFSESKVKSMLRRTREKLRLYLRKEGIEI